MRHFNLLIMIFVYKFNNRFFAGRRSNHGDNHLWRMQASRRRAPVDQHKSRTIRLFNFIDIVIDILYGQVIYAFNLNDRKKERKNE